MVAAALQKPTVPKASSKVVQPVFDAGVMTVDLSASPEAEEAGDLPSCMPHRGCSIHVKEKLRSRTVSMLDQRTKAGAAAPKARPLTRASSSSLAAGPQWATCSWQRRQLERAACQLYTVEDVAAGA